ncbi:M20 family metallopeptidase [Pseudomonas brassicacearum]|jgi:hippurate hydrolase|uniref:Putative hippurate hydrolase n=1 Tax=Pseudomonas brassicacearum (strain NFM421) TaxID=994484 RepID=F2KGG1_PSEBN|nr:M20 aminoacylase family protein [Pseudomonas brassicacearum]EIK65621.1 amidohydrolase [Pseudomonas fluorescens Q8r1-96]KIR18342.1 putative hydrolase YxeP [Pseudomonas fluorescens]AEA68420.1 putative hippurate hydrolase [Pseudomonas brassicacearum subsp. brassicacearum NFM421]ALQ02984.1 Metal-dependent amidase/aminoacylase/carboxypeptidase [Pseudomonas brassicacearum]AOS38234.1 peptidase M20 [Pseudomonas brassicacearum]
MSISKALIEDAITWRRGFHATPELGYNELQTSDRVAQLLESFGVEVHRGLGGTGVIGTLSNGQGPTIGIRADMDALPIQELGHCSHKSTHQGCMHACGHDGHTAILLATARHLSETRHFSGTVHFVFQPAEEGLAGAKKMIDDGLFKQFPMDAIYGLHNWPGAPAGHVVINPGPMMASLDTFEITLTGKGCHAAMPDKGADPIIAAAQLILALQTIPSRRLSPLDSAVISVTQINAGEAINVIPETAVIKGTVRCLQSPVRDKVQALIGQFVEQLPVTFDVKGQLTYLVGYPVTENHPQAASMVRRAAVAAVGESKVQWGCNPSMASEDFSFMLQACPGAYLWMGVDGEKPSAALHNPYYDFNDQVIEPGVAVWTQLVEQSLPLT